jgi:hypothetical protein
MKWFKHLSTASNDLFLKDLESEFGDSGYTFWFKTLELIASQGEDGVLTISETAWRQVIASHRTDHLRRLYTFASNRDKLITERAEGGMLKVSCKKFAEYSDNYTKYGTTSKTLQSDLNKVVPNKKKNRIEEDIDKKSRLSDPDNAFESLWSAYPRREGKKSARRHFDATVQTDEALAEITEALRRYIHHLEIMKTEAKYIKMGSTWFNDWLEWATFEEPVNNAKKPSGSSPAALSLKEAEEYERRTTVNS